MRIFLWVVLGIVALNAALVVVSLVAMGLRGRHGSRRIRELEALWRLKSDPSRRAASTPRISFPVYPGRGER